MALSGGLGLANRTLAKSGPERTKAARWPYHELDPEQSARRAYQGFYEAGCSSAVFSSIILPLGEQYGEPYRSFPLGLMEYGKAGVVGYGSLCGAVNASAAAISLFHGGSACAKMITALFTWYEKTLMPTYIPKSPVVDFKLAETSANSILCHRSIGVWCEATGYAVSSKERAERCARVAADTSRRVTEILNDVAQGKLVVTGLPATTTGCLSCHGKKGELDNAKAKMNCSVCHDDKLTDHP